MASGTLAVGGLMSGIDTESMFTQLREAYRKPVQLMETRKEDYNVKLSAYSTLQAKLTALRAAAKEMDTSNEFASLAATSSDEDVLTASTISTAKDMTYNLQVKTLAQTHKVATANTYSSTQTLGAGDLTIQVGDNTARTITVESTDTIQDIADAINNDSSMDVVAATVYDGEKYRLMISAKESGEENIVNITVDENGTTDANIDSSGLSQLAYDNFKTKTASKYDTAGDTAGSDFSTGSIYINNDYYINVESGDTMQDIVDKINDTDYWYDLQDIGNKMDATDIAAATIAKAALVTDHTSGEVFIRADGVDSWYTTIEELRVDGTYMEENMYYKSETTFETDVTNLTGQDVVLNGTTVNAANTDADADIDIDDIVTGINNAAIPGITASTEASASSSSQKHLKITGIQAKADGSPNYDFSGAPLFDPSAYSNGMYVNSKNMTRSQYGQDATMVLDGTTIKRDSNTIDDMLTGITLNLNKTSYNSTTSSYDTVTLDITRDSSAMIEKFEAVADAYNDLVDFFEEFQGVQLKEDESSKSLEDSVKDLITILAGEELESNDDDSPIKYGPLMGDSTTSMIKDKLFNISFSDVNGVNASYNNLTEMGITLNYGKMTIDKEQFTAAASANADAINEFFTNDSTSSKGFAVQLIEAIDNMVENYASDQKGILLTRQEGIQTTIDRLDEQIASQDERINATMERTRAQFNSLEVLMGQYQTTSSYLASQLASMAG